MASIYQEPQFGAAQVRVALVSTQGQADLLVCRMASPGLARGDALWFITPQRGLARTTIHLCSLGMADLRVCFVSTPGAAGWRVKARRWVGRLA